MAADLPGRDSPAQWVIVTGDRYKPSCIGPFDSVEAALAHGGAAFGEHPHPDIDWNTAPLFAPPRG